MAAEGALQGDAGDAQKGGDIAAGQTVRGHGLMGLADRVFVQPARPADRPAPVPGRFHALTGAPRDQAALILRDPGEHGADQFPLIGAGIDAERDDPKEHAARPQALGGGQRLKGRAESPVEIPDHQRIAGPEAVQHLPEHGAVRGGGGDFLQIEPVADGMQALGLPVFALVAGGDAHIADALRRGLHGMTCSKPIGIVGEHGGKGLALAPPRFGLGQRVVIVQGLRAQHVGDHLRGLIVPHTEDLPGLDGAEKALQGGGTEVAGDLPGVLEHRPGADTRPPAIGEGAQQRLEAPQLPRLVGHQQDARRLGPARLVEHGDGEDQPDQRRPQGEELGRDVEEQFAGPVRVGQGRQRHVGPAEGLQQHRIVEKAQRAVDRAHDGAELARAVLLFGEHLRGRPAHPGMGRIQHRFELPVPGMGVGFDHADDRVQIGERDPARPRRPGFEIGFDPLPRPPLEIHPVLPAGERDQAFGDELHIGMEAGRGGIENVERVAAVAGQSAQAERIDVPGRRHRRRGCGGRWRRSRRAGRGTGRASPATRRPYGPARRAACPNPPRRW